MNNFYLIANGDDGKKYGFGHIFRAIRIYKKLEKKLKNYKFIFLVNDKKKLAKKIQFYAEKKIEVKNIKFLKKNKFNKNDFLLFDTLGIEKNFLNIINSQGLKNIITLDQTFLKGLKKVLIINGIFFSKKKLVSKNKNIRILQGAEYNTIENDSERNLENISKIKEKKIFLSSGGADKKDMILKFLNIFKKNHDLKILIPVGPGFKTLQIEKFKKYKNVKLFYNIKNSLSLISKCDLSIVNGGLTMFESLVAKKPTFVVQTFSNQKFAIKYFYKKK